MAALSERLAAMKGVALEVKPPATPITITTNPFLIENITRTAGKAFDVVGERVKTSQKVLGKRSRKDTWRITVRNHKREKAAVHVVERLNPAFGGTEWEIVSESIHHTKKTANVIEYLVGVPAKGKAEITYTVIYRW